MLNRFSIIISLIVKSAANLIFRNGFSIKAFLPFDIDFGYVDLELRKGFMAFRSTLVEYDTQLTQLTCHRRKDRIEDGLADYLVSKVR